MHGDVSYGRNHGDADMISLQKTCNEQIALLKTLFGDTPELIRRDLLCLLFKLGSSENIFFHQQVFYGKAQQISSLTANISNFQQAAGDTM